MKNIVNSWERQFNILWWGQIILMTMLSMSIPFWPLYIKTLGDFTATEVNYLSAAIYVAPYLSCIIVSPLWGKFGDTHGHKSMVIRASLGLFITQALIIFCHSVYLIFAVRLIQGALAGFIVAAQSWALGISPIQKRGTIMGHLQAATAVGTFFGPLLGGVLIAYANYQILFSVSAFCCAVVTLIFYLYLHDTACSTTLKNHVSKKWSFFSFQRLFILILFSIIFVQLARSMIVPVFALFVTEQLNGNVITTGILYAITGIMIFISSSYWGNFFDRMTRKGVSLYLPLLGILFYSALIQLFFSLTKSIEIIFILRLCWGIGLGALLPILLRLLLEQGNDNEKGAFLGLGNSAINFGEMLGMAFGAYFELRMGMENIFLASAIIFAMLFLIVSLNVKQIWLLRKVGV